MNKLLVKNGAELNQDEIDQIDKAKTREFKALPLQKKDLSTGTFFLLVDGKRMLATGQVILVEPVNFNGGSFSILGVGGILANERGKGCGKQIMTAIRDYLITKDKTGVGFCALRNKGFYEKCGFIVDTTFIKRFVFQKGDEKVTNSGDDCVLYLDASDHFIEKVLSRPNEEVVLPRAPDW